MSIEVRKKLVDPASKRLIFQNGTQRADLLDEKSTQTGLIALLLELTQRGPLEITAVRTDHHDDSALGLHCHANGYAVDCWPLYAYLAGDYMDAASSPFALFLYYVARANWLYQVGLAGTADTPANRSRAGSTAFSDVGADHIHLGAL